MRPGRRAAPAGLLARLLARLLAVLLTGLLAMLLAGLLPVPTPAKTQSAAAAAFRATPPPKRPHPHRKPWPITLTVRTVPALPGLRLAFDGTVRRTDAAGRVTFTEEHNFRPHQLGLLDTKVNSPDRQLKFVRWAGQRDPLQAFRPTVTGLPMRMSYTVTAAFAVQYRVSIGLIDGHGAWVPPGRVSDITLRSGVGSAVRVQPGATFWLDAVVPSYRNSAIALVDEVYSLTSVMVGGTNTVDAGRQRFQPAHKTRPVFRTKFYDLGITAHDLMFSGRTGTAALVTYPDGTQHRVEFDANGHARLLNLPRGSYRITLDGGGTTVPSQLVLSRNAEVDLPVLTHRDYGVGVLAIAGLGAGLLLVGRGRLLIALAAARRRRGREVLNA